MTEKITICADIGLFSHIVDLIDPSFRKGSKTNISVEFIFEQYVIIITNAYPLKKELFVIISAKKHSDKSEILMRFTGITDRFSAELSRALTKDFFKFIVLKYNKFRGTIMFSFNKVSNDQQNLLEEIETAVLAMNMQNILKLSRSIFAGLALAKVCKKYKLGENSTFREKTKLKEIYNMFGAKFYCMSCAQLEHKIEIPNQEIYMFVNELADKSMLEISFPMIKEIQSCDIKNYYLAQCCEKKIDIREKSSALAADEEICETCNKRFADHAEEKK